MVVVFILSASACGGSEDTTAFSQFVTKYELSAARVTYHMKIGSSQNSSSFEINVTAYSDSSELARQDVGDATLIRDAAGRTISCDAGRQECSYAQGQQDAWFDSVLRSAESIVKGAPPSRNTVAGEDAECFSLSDDGPHPTRVCFAEDGVLLSLAASHSDGKWFDLEATEVSRDVSSADFALPYHLTEQPSGD